MLVERALGYGTYFARLDLETLASRVRSDFVTSLSLQLTTPSTGPKIRCIYKDVTELLSPWSGTEPANNNCNFESGSKGEPSV